jgi:SAM-dependent methyltransferase
MDLEQQTRIACFSKYATQLEFGLEIGASYRPTFPKQKNWNVKTLDHTNKTGLLEKYGSLSVPKEKLDEIEEVDVVWNGKPYSEMFDKNSKFDYVVAAHVIEHTEDLLDFFNQLSIILKEGGFIFLAVPDKKATFDFYRPISTIGDVILGSLNPKLYDIKAHIDEMFMKCELNGTIAWNRDVSINAVNSKDFPTPAMSELEAVETVNKYVDSNLDIVNPYRDAHRWVFTPESLSELIRILRIAGLIDFEVIEVVTTNYYEFLMVLRKTEKSDVVLSTNEMRMKYLIDNSPAF